MIDFGLTLGRKRSCAQITEHYSPADLIGRQVAALLNFSPCQIGETLPEVLTLGFGDANGAVVLFFSDAPVPDGCRLF